MYSHLLQFNLIGHHHGLNDAETKELWVQADIDGNDVLDYKKFQVIILMENVSYLFIFYL